MYLAEDAGNNVGASGHCTILLVARTMENISIELHQKTERYDLTSWLESSLLILSASALAARLFLGAWRPPGFSKLRRFNRWRLRINLPKLEAPSIQTNSCE